MGNGKIEWKGKLSFTRWNPQGKRINITIFLRLAFGKKERGFDGLTEQMQMPRWEIIRWAFPQMLLILSLQDSRIEI
jgi:hypothetical protein